MAKGNMLLGYSRGSVGDVTFTKIKGQQVARARNRNPRNPRTNKQSLQRAIFAAAVKFYTRGIQSFYKFAFETKRQVESDYNAFMRENVKRAPAISREAFANYDYPIIAPFIMSKGSLAPVNNVMDGGDFYMIISPVVQGQTIDTIGQLSTVLTADSNYQVGDIITTVSIISKYNGVVPSADASGSGKTTWTIKQFVIDPDNTETIQSVMGSGISNITIDGTEYNAIQINNTSGGFSAGVAVHSRNTDSGLKCSTQELILNTDAETAYEASMAKAYKEAVITSWQAYGSVDARPEAILKGSIAYSSKTD